MKRIKYVLVMFLIFASPTLLHAQSKPVITLYEMMRGNGTRETFMITEQAAARIPEWVLEKNEVPPLPVSKAVAIAKDWMKKKRPRDNKPDVESVKVQRVHWPELNNRWYYLIELNRVLKGFDSSGHATDVTLSDPAFVVVLMDGTTVDPISGR